jgi:enoyl-CoA hydratase/carnithine racemase
MSAQALPGAEPQATAPEGDVLVEIRNHIGHLTLNRPAGVNALTLEMVRTLRAALDEWALAPHVHAVMLRGAGPKGFCAGGDVRSLCDSYQAGDTLHETFFVEEYALDLCLHQYRKPVVVLMDGLTLGGGMGLAQAAELRIVTERSRLGMPEVGIGYFPDVGASWFLPRLPGEIGIYLGVSGVQLQAADALYCGLADWFVDSEKLALLDERLDRISWGDYPLKDLQGTLAKLGVQVLPDPPLDKLRPAIDHFFALPDIASMLEQMYQVTVADSQQWARSTALLMRSRSPLAMSVTLEMLRRGRQMTLEECFAMELQLDRQWFDQGDIVEGVRALLIDKDKAPRWNPATLQELHPERIEAFFEARD